MNPSQIMPITDTNKNLSAYLEIILGPMYSGKTSCLIEIFNQCLCNFISVVVINSVKDNRYSDTMLVSHDKVKIPCMRTESILELVSTSNVKDAQVILINEGQFFMDLELAVRQLLEMGKQIYVCGLDGDFERKKFGQMLDIIPLCDKVTKRNSICRICNNFEIPPALGGSSDANNPHSLLHGKPGNAAIFSKRIGDELEQVLIGSDNYIPVCRNCYAK